MPRYYCDYCDTYLTHDSPSVRKQHNAGYKHKANVRTYYQQFEEQQTQSLIDQKIKEHLGQSAVQYQAGANFNQFLQANPQRPRLPVLPAPMMLMGAPNQMPMGFVPGVRAPVLPLPVSSAPGYGAPPSMAPPGATSMPMQMNNLPRPPMLNPLAPGVPTAPTSHGATTLNNTVTYQAGPLFTSGPSTAPAGTTNSQDGFAYSQASETNH